MKVLKFVSMDRLQGVRVLEEEPYHFKIKMINVGYSLKYIFWRKRSIAFNRFFRSFPKKKTARGGAVKGWVELSPLRMTWVIDHLHCR